MKLYIILLIKYDFIEIAKFKYLVQNSIPRIKILFLQQNFCSATKFLFLRSRRETNYHGGKVLRSNLKVIFA